MSVEKIRIITINEDSLERCRPLCDALMQYQAEKSTLHTEVLAVMNFDNRLKASFLSTQNKTLIGAEYDGKIIGYAYATTHLMTTEGRYFLPDWLRAIYKEGQLVFYPDQQELPATIGVFNNLYVTPQFHGKGVGGKLAHQLMQWLYHTARLPTVMSTFPMEMKPPWHPSTSDWDSITATMCSMGLSRLTIRKIKVISYQVYKSW